MIRRHSIFCMLFVVLLIASCFSPSKAIAQTAVASGYRVTYHDVWPSSARMKFVRVTVSPMSGAATEDVDFHVIFKTTNYNAMKFSTVVSLKKGDTSAVGEIYAVVDDAYGFSFHTELDGNLQEGRDDFASYSYNDFNNNSNVENPAVVFASSEVKKDQTVSYIGLSKTVSRRQQFPASVALSPQFPDLTKVGEAYDQGANTTAAGGRILMDLNGVEEDDFAAVSLAALPSKWFGYEGLDFVVLTQKDLKSLSADYPVKFLALQRWIAASGRLVVINCGAKLAKAKSALTVFGEDFVRNVDGRVIYRRGAPGQRSFATFKNGLLNRSGKLVGNDDEEIEADLMAVPLHGGKIICVSDEGSDWGANKKRGISRWRQLLNFSDALNEKEQLLQNKEVLFNGTLSLLGFPEFAEPPRFLFESSILLYLIAVGPLAFFLLKRRNQLNLLFVLVPAFSALCCFVILMYAVFAEGFDTRVNVVTVSQLDQQNGRLSTDSISHVYAGLSPGSYRIDDSSFGLVNSSYRNRRSLLVKQRSDEQEISGGEIRARTNHQVFMRSSSETDVGLGVVVEGSDQDPIARVRNGFGSQLQLAFFRTDDCGREDVWLVRSVAAGEVAVAEKCTFDELSKELRAVVRERMQPSILISGGSTESSYSSRRNYTNRLFNQQQNLGVESSVCATSLNRLKTASKAWLRTQTERSGGHGYVAIVDDGENFEMPVPDANIEGSLHVIYGAW